MKRAITVLGAVALAACAEQAANQEPTEDAAPPNVVFLVGDGFGVGAWSAARVVAGLEGKRLTIDDPDALGFLDTRCLDDLVTDSAAAASAWATGRLAPRFQVGFPGEDVPNLFERLRDAGRAFGFVTTARVTHYTLAPFYARSEHRRLEDDIAAQLVEAAPDVAIGGGARHFLPEAGGGHRRDGRNLLEEARGKGTDAGREFHAPLPVDAPVLLVLEDSHLPHELDRRSDEPGLAELAVAAVRKLEAEGAPWFLLVEAARIDHAAHHHDGPGLIRNTLGLDAAVRAVLDEVDLSRTLVVVGADHETANPTLLEFAHPESLDVVTASVERMERQIFRGRPWAGTPRSLEERALPVIDRGARHTGLSARDLDRLLRARNVYERRTALGNALSRRFGIAFIDYDDHLASEHVHGHNGDLVPVRAWGPRAAEVVGIRDHGAFGRWLADVLELPLPEESVPGGETGAGAAAPIDTVDAAG